MNCSTPGLPVHHQVPESTQTHVHQVSDAIQHLILCHPFSSCPQSFPASGSFQMSQLFASGGQSTGVSKKQEKNQINNLTLHLKQLEKEEMKNPRISRRKEIIKTRAEISEKETKATIAKSTNLKAGSLRR